MENRLPAIDLHNKSRPHVLCGGSDVQQTPRLLWRNEREGTLFWKRSTSLSLCFEGHSFPERSRPSLGSRRAFSIQKWTQYTSEMLVPLISHSPVVFWLLPAFGVRGAGYFLAITETIFGSLIFLGYWNPRLGILGALGSIETFTGTITIIPFLPGAWAPEAGGFPIMTLPLGFPDERRAVSCRVILSPQAGSDACGLWRTCEGPTARESANLAERSSSKSSSCSRYRIGPGTCVSWTKCNTAVRRIDRGNSPGR